MNRAPRKFHERLNHVREEQRQDQHEDDSLQPVEHPDAGADGGDDEEIAEERSALRERRRGGF